MFEIIKTNPIDHDSDDDGLLDGLELGVYENIFESDYNGLSKIK